MLAIARTALAVGVQALSAAVAPAAPVAVLEPAPRRQALAWPSPA